MNAPGVDQLQSRLSVIVQINLSLLWAFCLGVAAWFCWPPSLQWYGFGFLSLCAGGAAFGLIIKSARLAVALYKRDKLMEAFLSQGSKPKSSSFASADDLDDAGMR